MEAMVFLYPHLRIAVLYFCHFLFARNESYLSSLHTQGEGIYIGPEKEEVGSVGSLLGCQTQIES